MQIRLRNQIQIDDQTEIIDQIYEADWTQKGGSHYLLYTNEEGEKAVLKFQEEELVMTRFSTPKSIMRFIKGGLAPVSIPTPLGLQHFITQTEHYQLDMKEQTIQLRYELKTPDSVQTFARYRLEISWS
ncbi:hypothetical protein STRDD11_01036 [Streptococcus sp. DD11]|uniref:DUF1934 domain-containing protein n=1 Tax=Streptococcus sp. DD11 TaxID=1777879 RepID=UPI00079BB11E|nr:DUF1934 domain-containing protein [Streptococcus sp. DD11]KXT84291.1 hypothetical protein STRDD11_01036 [Streptococcus sp. DD11]